MARFLTQVRRKYAVLNHIVFDFPHLKQLEVLSDLLGENEIGMPYDGAKPHYIIDADDREQLQAVVTLLEPLTALLKKRRKKS